MTIDIVLISEPKHIFLYFFLKKKKKSNFKIKMNFKEDWWVVLFFILLGIPFLCSVCNQRSSGDSSNSGYNRLPQSSGFSGIGARNYSQTQH